MQISVLVVRGKRKSECGSNLSKMADFSREEGAGCKCECECGISNDIAKHSNINSKTGNGAKVTAWNREKNQWPYFNPGSNPEECEFLFTRIQKKVNN